MSYSSASEPKPTYHGPSEHDASPRDTGHEPDTRPKGDNKPPVTVEDSRPVGLAPLTEAEELERAFLNRCVRGPAPDDPDAAVPSPDAAAAIDTAKSPVPDEAQAK